MATYELLLPWTFIAIVGELQALQHIFKQKEKKNKEFESSIDICFLGKKQNKFEILTWSYNCCF